MCLQKPFDGYITSNTHNFSALISSYDAATPKNRRCLHRLLAGKQPRACPIWFSAKIPGWNFRARALSAWASAETSKTLHICLRIEAERLNPRRSSLDKVHATQVVGHCRVERRLRVVASSHIATAKHACPIRSKIMQGCAMDSLEDVSRWPNNPIPRCEATRSHNQYGPPYSPE